MKRALVVIGLAACGGNEGVISVGLATAPGSTLLDSVQRLRLEVTNPPKVLMAERSGDGFELGLDLPAGDNVGALYVDGFDAAGTLIATGASPRFTFSGADGRVVVYMAAPDSVAVAPETLDPPRSELGAGLLGYGAILAGGRTADGPSDALEIYNAYDHTLLSGLPLPAPRSGLAVGVGMLGVYLFGGAGEASAPTATLWRFDPTVRPLGQFFIIGDKDGFARAGETLLPLGNDRFLLTGTPAAELHGLDGSVAIRDDITTLPAAAVMTTANDGVATAIFAGATGIVRFRASQFEVLSAPGRTGSVVAVPGGKVAILCGGEGSAIRIDAASAAVETFPSIPTTAKSGCAVAATERHLLVAGGTSAAGIDATVEVYDAATFALVTSATLAVPRTGAIALPLANDQILIAGGLDASGAPVGTLELFTPAR